MAKPPLRLACIGECMIELTARDACTLDLRFGGDTLNTAVYAARRLKQAGRFALVDYVTALGDDPYSDWMAESWAAEGVGIGTVVRLSGRLPGLYMIRTDERGERTFHYWRSAAAARDLFNTDEIEGIARDLRAYDLVYLSGITLSIFDTAARLKLFALLDQVRRSGGLVAFDANFRPRGWPDIGEARAVMSEAWRRTDIGLPTFSDETMLYGDADPNVTIGRLRALGVGEIVVKRDRAPCIVAVGDDAHAEIKPELVDSVVDSTAAGDSFNGAYLAARLCDTAPFDAAAAGHRVAASVIQHPGAIIPIDAMPRD